MAKLPSSISVDVAKSNIKVRDYPWRISLHCYAIASPLNDLKKMTIEDRGPQITATAIVFLILPWIAVGLRCYVRIFMAKPFRNDDWLSVAALAWKPGSTVYIGITILIGIIGLFYTILRSRNTGCPLWHWTTPCRSCWGGHFYGFKGMFLA